MRPTAEPPALSSCAFFTRGKARWPVVPSRQELWVKKIRHRNGTLPCRVRVASALGWQDQIHGQEGGVPSLMPNLSSWREQFSDCLEKVKRDREVRK